MSNPFWEQQQQLFKTWNDTVTSQIPGMEAYANMYKAFAPNVTDYWSRLGEMMPNPVKSWQNMFGSVPSFDSFSEMWPFKVPGLDMYTKAFDLWKGLSNPASFLQDYQGKYMDLMQDMLKNFIPTGSLPFLGNSKELLDTCVDFYKNILEPWMKIDPSILERIAAGDQKAYVEFFKECNQRYEESFGKMFNMMGLGANREANADQMKFMSSYIKMLFSAGELVALVLNACQESMHTLLDRYQKNLKEGKMVTTFREFYDLWYNVTEEVLLELLGTDEFSKAFADFADKSSKYMIASNKMYERMLKPLPIPTKTDMDSLYRTVYDLRKDVRDLHTQLDALKATPEKK